MNRMEFILDEIDIENALIEYCKHNLNLDLRGMRCKVIADPDVSFPEACRVIADRMEKHT